jgi:hypothetical protein
MREVPVRENVRRFADVVCPGATHDGRADVTQTNKLDGGLGEMNDAHAFESRCASAAQQFVT